MDILNIRNEDGSWSEIPAITGPKGDTGPAGQNGADGKTPVKGIDYFTAEDKTELVNQVLTELPKWQNGGSY